MPSLRHRFEMYNVLNDTPFNNGRTAFLADKQRNTTSSKGLAPWVVSRKGGAKRRNTCLASFALR
jgi:hypothetical protein